MPPVAAPGNCQNIERGIDLGDRIAALNAIADAYDAGCDAVVIQRGAQARDRYRFKRFSILRETGNLFVQDGLLVAYVLESYERAYLSFLLAASYQRTGRRSDSMVELRRLDDEILARIYNFGDDPVIFLLSALLWEQNGERGEARVDWLRLTHQRRLDPEIAAFAQRRLAAIDVGARPERPWRVYSVGRFPRIDTELAFSSPRDGYFRLTPVPAFAADCASITGVRISTHSWFEKIALRYDYGYHPLLHLQSWIRLPFGVLYGLTTATAGAGVAFTGCVADAYARGNGSLCRLALEGGAALIRESPKVIEHTLEPDVRHWENVPAAFVATVAAEPADEPCYTRLPDGVQGSTIRLL